MKARSARTSMARFRVAAELLRFFWHGRWWWITPVVVAMLLFTALIVFTQSSALAPFLYTLF